MSNNVNLKISHSLSMAAGVRFPLPQNYQKWNLFLKVIWNVYGCFINLVFITEIISLSIRISLSPDDLGVFCAGFTGIGFILSSIGKLIVFNLRRKLFYRLFDEMRSVSNDLLSNPIDDGYDKFYDNQFVQKSKFLVSKFALEFSATSGLILIFIVRSLAVGVPQTAVTPAISWTPYNNTRNPMYSLTCFAEMVVYCNAVLRIVSFDYLVWCMLFVPTIQLRYLNYLMGIIIEENDHSDSSKNEELQRSERAQLNANFIWWVKYHQRILSIIQDFRAIASPYLVVNYLTNLLILFLAGVALISMEEWDIFQRVIINGILISNVIQLYIISLVGDWLRDCSQTAADPGFSSLLFVGDRSLRMNYLYVCARTKRSLDIRFGGIHKLSSESFEQLIRLMLTYFVTIVQLREERARERKGKA